MKQFLDDVDQRTQLIGQNRMELLLFHLGGKQRFGINVFKVREVIPVPSVRQMPGSHAMVRGIATIRGKTVSILDLARAIGYRVPRSMARDSHAVAAGDASSSSQHPNQASQLDQGRVVVTEFNRSVQGFWVSGVDRIVNVAWDQVKPPPRGTERESFLVAVTEIDGQWVEIIDVERVLASIMPDAPQVTGHDSLRTQIHGRIVVADDSLVARKQVLRVIEQLGLSTETFKDGQSAWEHFESLEPEVAAEYALLISDIEMPRMDGYTLTTRLRTNPNFANLKILLHSSLSGSFNEAMVRKAGADRFLSKFDPNDLVNAVQDVLEGKS